MGLVGAVEGGVSGPETLGMVEPRCHEGASEIAGAIQINQAYQTKMRIVRVLFTFIDPIKG